MRSALQLLHALPIEQIRANALRFGGNYGGVGSMVEPRSWRHFLTSQPESMKKLSKLRDSSAYLQLKISLTIAGNLGLLAYTNWPDADYAFAVGDIETYRA